MRNGAYVTFYVYGDTHKGRLVIRNGDYYICQNIVSGSANLSTQYGNEFAWCVGNASSFPQNVKEYRIKQVSKTTWEAIKEPIEKTVFGYDVYISNGIAKFGCGDVTLPIEDINQFIKEKDEYLKLIKKRDSVQELVNQEERKINEWLTQHRGVSNVVQSVRRKGFRVENVNIDKLKRIIGYDKNKPRKVRRNTSGRP